MPIVILIPTVICIFALFRQSVQKCFQDLYIPMFMMVPAYYFWKVAALPPINFADSICLPLGIAMIFQDVRRWRFAPMDLAVAAFLFTTWYADSLNKQQTASTFDLFESLCVALVPYMAGKLLIEHNNQRVPTVKRMVFCLFLAGIFSVYEYRMGQNPFTLAIARFFPDEQFPWKTQIRWGFGRVSGPFGQSELAGMMFLFALVLTLWLAYNHLWEPKFRHSEWLPGKKSAIITWTVATLLLMTQARGPWLGAIVAVPVALIGRSTRVLRTAILVAIFVVVGGAIAYVGLKAYTSGPSTSEAQENAAYRAQMLDNYIPIAENGGPWGWGQDFPRVMGQGSIDNEYLFVALTQGWVGLGALLWISSETLYYLLYGAVLNPGKQDRYFSWSMLGIFLGLLLTVFTVFLGNQPYQLFFLMAGWSQAVRIKRAPRPSLVFQQVYT